MGQEASFTFTTPLNVNLVTLKGEEHLFVEGVISTNDIDFVNDIMTKNCQESMQRQILERNMKLDLEHEAFKGDTHEEKEINKTKIPAGKIIDATVKELEDGSFATTVKCEINRYHPNYKSIKGNLVEKYLDAFSVAFLPIDISWEQKEGKAIRMLNDVILLNVAMTGNPCNTKAQMADVFIKSMDALEEYKKRKEEDSSFENNLVIKGGPGSGPRKGQGGGTVLDNPSSLEKEIAKRKLLYRMNNPSKEDQDKAKKFSKLSDSKKAKIFAEVIAFYSKKSLENGLKEKPRNVDKLVEEMLNWMYARAEKKTQALYSVTDKLYGTTKLTPKEIKLLKAVLDLAENKGAAKELEKELMEKILTGIKLDSKERMLFNSLLEVKNEQEMAPCDTACKSYSTGKTEDLTKLHTKNSKMTDKTEEELEAEAEAAKAEEAEAEGSDDVDKKSVEMFKSISNELKSMNEKYDAVVKDNVSMKEAQSEMTKTLAKITDALSQPIHKSLNNNESEEDKKKAEEHAAEGKSVDPIGLCH